MALVLANRVQESGTANTTVSFTLTGAAAGFQSFAVIGNTNTTYYSATDPAGNWEVGLGTYSTTGPTLTRTTIYASSNTGSAVTFSGAVSVFVTYPSGRSVNLDSSGNVSALGTVASGTWQGSTIGVAYGGTGVTTSSGANSVVLRDSDQNITVNRVNQANTNTTAAAGTTVLTTASSYIQTLVGTGGQTYALPDATTLTTGVAFVFNNLATGNLTITDYATATIVTIPSGGAGAVFLTANATVGGTWDLHAYLPEGVTFGTNAFNLGSAVISGGTWQGGTIQPAYGGTGLTTFVGANNALFSTGSTTLTAGTLPSAAGGTGTNTVTTGDLLYGSATNTWSKLPIGGAYRTLVVNAGGTQVEWNAVALDQATAVSGTLDETNGGTGQNGYTLGDTLYSSASNTLAKLPGNTTTTKKFLSQMGTGAVSAAPAWDTISGSDVTGNISGQAGSVANALTAGTYLTSGGTYNGSVARTFTVDATDANTASKVVARDASGNFSAGTITASLNGNASTATSATNATNLTGSGSISSTTTATTQAAKTSDTTVATTAFVDRLRSLLTQSTAAGGGTLVIGDRGTLVSVTAGVTVPASVFAANDVVTIYNNTAGSITITQGASLTLRQVGTANTGNRTLAQRGIVTVVFISATEAVVSGGGLT